jgi:hypothetical protein
VKALWCWAAGLVLLAAVVTGCQEKLTSPADCPALCPGGTAEVLDTVVTAEPSRDSSFTGYVDRGAGPALLVSNGFAVSEDRALYRFVPRGDSVTIRDTLRSYAVDSVMFTVNVVARDTLVNGLKIYLYRLPSAVDSTATFAGIDPLLNPATLIDSIAVPDTLNTGAFSVVVRNGEVGFGQVTLPPGGDSVMAIGLKIAADTPTGIRVGSLGSSTGATFTSYVTVDIPDTTSIRHQTLARATTFNTFVTQNPLVPSDTLLTVGGEPSSRALIRFGLSNAFLDSTTIVRATLELTPVRPIAGLPTDPALIQALALVADLGAKSPLTTDVRFIQQDTLPALQTDTVRMDITSTVKLWQSTRARPQSVFLKLLPEAASFTRAQFFSTRSHAGDTVVAPRLRITYQRSFPFENP